VHPAPPVAQRQFGAFSRQQAVAAGWSRSALFHAVRSGQLRVLHRGVFVAADAMDGVGPAADRRRLVVATASALLATRAATASHASAAVLAELPIWRLPERPCITVLPRYTGDAEAAHLHRATLPERYRRSAGRLTRTSAARTVCDLAREHGIDDAVVAADAALHHRVMTRDDLDRCLIDCIRWPGVRRARRAAGLADARSESPLETVSRLRLDAVGMPRPDLQPQLFDVGGRWLGRVDFYWDEHGVVGEVDGKSKYASDHAVLWEEKLRQERLEEAGLIVVRWGLAQLGDLPRLIDRLCRAFARGERRGADERRWIARSAA
jgi:hypothetical protein